MKSIDKIDKNFKVETKIERVDVEFFSALERPFEVFGVFHDGEKFRRMPEKEARAVSDGVLYLHSNTSGGRVRFKTDSSFVAINNKMCNIGKMDHFALTGSGGFDLYVREDGQDKFTSTFRPPFGVTEGYESLFEFKTNEMREITINFPLYSDVCELYIGLEQGAKIEPPTPYKNGAPVVYYGSSITQGGCASRPGNAYPSILSRKYNLDFLNLGFSGSARGEKRIAEYIAALDMYAFVYDYDHNAPSAQHLESTHEPMFKLIRDAHPNMPIIIMSGTSMDRCFDNKPLRREIIYKTYKNACDAGDENVYFWDGTKEFAPYEEWGTVEGCHPNDVGFLGMAKTLEKIFEKILSKEKNNGK